jgi:exonuclease VII small subunit
MPPSNPPRSVPADIAALSFEDALKELEGIV